MSIVDISTKSEFDALLGTHRFVALQAHATWCGPCKAISPIFTKFATELLSSHDLGGRVAFARFDTDEVPDLTFDLGIRSLPTFVFFRDGDKTDALAGANPPALKKLIEGMGEAARV